jgi:hypothetical protein
MQQPNPLMAAIASTVGKGGPAPGAPSPMGAPNPAMIGTISTGDAATPPNTEISQAVLALQDVANKHPEAQDRVMGMIAELRTLAMGQPKVGPASGQGPGLAGPPTGISHATPGGPR